MKLKHLAAAALLIFACVDKGLQPLVSAARESSEAASYRPAADQAEFRFPMPEFESGYKHPEMNVPLPARIPAAVDITVLFVALGATAWSVLKLRSRPIVFLIAVFSLVYFGFYRKGCVCPVGSLQNIVNALIDRNFAVPLIVTAFFLLPLVFALYFGRVFCAAVCPLGAIQEMCAVRPVQVPRPVETTLGLLAYAYLGLTVLSLVTGTGFLICRYDPFIGFFRQGASFNMLLVGGGLLLIGVFVARPYCRFLCPYGVLLRWASLFSKWHASITPAECIQCRLCELSCPYGAIVVPMPSDRPVDRRTGAKRLGLLLLLTPVIIGITAWTGMTAHEMVARLHPTVRLAERVAAEEQGRFAETTIDSDAFRAGKQSPAELYAEAIAIKQRFKHASAWFGGFIGLVICGKLIRLSVIRKSRDYEADRGACLSCARCFAYCPVEAGGAPMEDHHAQS
jgi:ferredoxin